MEYIRNINKKVPYHMDRKLVRLWEKNNLYNMKKYNTDRVYIVDGRERAGKSWFAMQQMCYLEPSLLKSTEKFVSRICFSPKEFDNTCRNIKNGVIVFDEAFRGLSSRSALSKTNKMIVQTLMEMGQNNNIVFIVLPSFFLLDVYPAMLRSDNLFHVYQDPKNKLRAFVGYNRDDKNQIYQQGLRKGWKYTVYSKFRGRYYGKFPGGDEFEAAYLKKKDDYVKRMVKEDVIPEKEDRIKVQRDILITKLMLEENLTEKGASEWFEKYKIKLDATNYGQIKRLILKEPYFREVFQAPAPKKEQILTQNP